ncbi:hypothetical protein PSH79_11730 [Pseudomonas sp. FP2196]|uniref:hypothetical protein n=1 Tax=Pseudomonas sp. FP2196 TaxID=2954086 RepID=UPI0027370BEE|nr:hypothetical protein [Pseudomonas sp. FP2196]WLH37932.1 hypothetical protein PSH79_11730 [Pseudomonas sp. FP2196]
MRDVSNGDKPTVVTLVNGEATQVSFSSVSLGQNEIRVNTADGNRIDVQMPGMNVALHFDLDEAASAQTAAEVEKPARLFNVVTVLVTLTFLVVVGSVSFWLGFIPAVLFFGYRWRSVAKHNKRLATQQAQRPEATQGQPIENGSGMSRQAVRNALSRKR